MKIVSKLKKSYEDLPDKKKYFELISAALTIPVMGTVLMMNINNLKAQQKPTVVASATAPTVTPSTPPPTKIALSINPTPTSIPCKKQIGDVAIVSPLDGEVIPHDPVNIDIDSNDPTFCPVVWSYSINNSDWSDFTTHAINVYNLSPGAKNLQIKVKNPDTGEQKILTRNFIFQSNLPTPTATSTPTPTAIPSLTASPTLAPSPTNSVKSN